MKCIMCVCVNTPVGYRDEGLWRQKGVWVSGTISYSTIKVC